MMGQQELVFFKLLRLSIVCILGIALTGGLFVAHFLYLDQVAVYGLGSFLSFVIDVRLTVDLQRLDPSFLLLVNRDLS